MSEEKMKILKRVLLIVLICIIGGLYSYGIWTQDIYDTSVDSNSYEGIGNIGEGDSISQTFLCQNDGLQAIDLKLSDQGQKIVGVYDWKLTEKASGSIAASGNINPGKIDDSSVYALKFTKQKYSKNKEYTLSIIGKEITSEYGMTIMKTNGCTQRKGLQFNNDELDQTAVISLKNQYFNVETCVVFIGMLMYLVFFVRFLLKIFK